MKTPFRFLCGRRHSFKQRFLFWLFAATPLAARLAQAHEEVWVGVGSGLWSNANNWLDGSAPAAGGDPVLSVRFTGTSTRTATDDLAGLFALNNLVLDMNGASLLTVAASAGNGLRFTGSAPRIELRGIGNAALTAPLQLDAPLTITGSGTGQLAITGAIVAGSIAPPLIIDTGAIFPGISDVQLGGTQTFGGGVVLQSGNLSVLSDSALGTGALTVRSGTLSLVRGTSASRAVSNAIALEGDLVVRTVSTTLFTASLNGVISSATPGAGLALRTAGDTLTLTAASTYTGATTLDYSSDPASATLAGGTLSLGHGSSLLGTSEFQVRAGSTLSISGRTSADNRVGDQTPIHLRSGGLAYVRDTAGSALQTETVGSIDGAGFSPISVTSSGGSSPKTVLLTAQSLTRTERGTFVFRGSNLGGSIVAGVGNIAFNTAPSGLTGGSGTGPATSILPYAVGDTNGGGSGTGFVSYNATDGIRLLNPATDYRSTIAAASEVENVRLTTAETLDMARTVNALILSGGSLNGTGTLTLASGALLGGGTIAVPLNFGGIEANIFGSLTISGAISGTNGLTCSAGLTLAGANTFIGSLTINTGTIRFSAAENLGADTSPIVVNGHGAGLNYFGASALTLSRGIETRTGLAKISMSGLGDLTLNAPITGAGSTYTGPTDLGSGRVVIPEDSALGGGGALNLRGSTLALSGSWITSRTVFVSSGSTLDTAGFDAVLSGAMTGSGLFTKLGVGRLTVTNAAGLSAGIKVAAGTLAFPSAGLADRT